jgi:hypothetical protein
MKYKGFELRRVRYWSAMHEPSKPVFCRPILYVEYLIIRDGRILDRALKAKNAKARIDSGVYNK